MAPCNVKLYQKAAGLPRRDGLPRAGDFPTGAPFNNTTPTIGVFSGTSYAPASDGSLTITETRDLWPFFQSGTWIADLRAGGLTLTAPAPWAGIGIGVSGTQYQLDSQNRVTVTNPQDLLGFLLSGFQ